ncbi:hypothetical protein ACFRCW_36010 [Streptomyces sp. NPDC056653]|uniref:hypothetical protein n=1 Tax=Streptomyces sp. NPDC056653 TaxID=3345894 RepID=UPI003686D9E0
MLVQAQRLVQGVEGGVGSLLAYLSRIVTWYPAGERPDGSLVRQMIEDYRLEEYIPAGGERG